MSRQQPQLPVSSPRLLASAIGMAITAGSAGHMVFAAEKTDEKAPGNTISLGATAITGEAQDETSYNVEKASSPKYTAPLVDTPRSITVIPQQVLKDTGALNMQDALRTVPGITFGAGEGGNPQGDRPFIRGFDAQGDTYLDGVRDTGSQSREIFAVESIEVSKGPNSAIGGRGAAGGSINLVSKKAHLGDSLDGGFTWGSDQTQRYTLDGNYQFTDTAAGRLNLMSHESNVAGRDSVDYDRWGVAPSLAFGLGTDTRVNLDYYHLESNDTPDSGIPYSIPAGGSAARTKSNPDKPNDGGDSSNFYGLNDRDFRKGRTDTATIAIEHDLNDALTVKNTLRHGSSMQDYILTQPDDSKGNVNNGSVWRRANTRVSNTETTTNQTDLFGDVYIAGFKNSFATGIEFSREESKKSSYTVNTDTTPGNSCCDHQLHPGTDRRAKRLQLHLAVQPEPERSMERFDLAQLRRHRHQGKHLRAVRVRHPDVVRTVAGEHGPALRPFRHRLQDLQRRRHHRPPRAMTSASSSPVSSVWSTNQRKTAASMRPTRRPPPLRAPRLAKVRKATRWAAPRIATATC